MKLTEELVEGLEASLTRELEILEQLDEISSSLLVERGKEIRESVSHDPSRSLLAELDGAVATLREQRAETLADLQAVPGEPVRMTTLIARLPPAQAERFTLLREQLISKIIRIRSMNFAAQMSLVYRMDYYRQLVTAISGDTSSQDIYQSSGRLENTVSGNPIVQDC